MKKLLLFVLFLTALCSCGVNKDVHNKALADLRRERLSNDELSAKSSEQKKTIEKAKKLVKKLRSDVKKLRAEIKELNQNFLDAMDFNENLKKRVEKLGSSVEDLASKKGELSKERERLMDELEELRRMKEAAERRNAEFKNILSKLKKMIDAGSLSVEIRKGRMIVSLSSDILFASGSARLTKEGGAAITELSQTLRELEDRSFLVTGHSDATPIRTKRYPSNWELSSQRAIEVVKLMIKNEVPPSMLIAAGNGEFDPIADNETKEGRKKNRRVEIVFLPRIDELPGFNMDNKKEESEEISVQKQAEQSS